MGGGGWRTAARTAHGELSLLGRTRKPVARGVMWRRRVACAPARPGMDARWWPSPPEERPRRCRRVRSDRTPTCVLRWCSAGVATRPGIGTAYRERRVIYLSCHGVACVARVLGWTTRRDTTCCASGRGRICAAGPDDCGGLAVLRSRAARCPLMGVSISLSNAIEMANLDWDELSDLMRGCVDKTRAPAHGTKAPAIVLSRSAD